MKETISLVILSILTILPTPSLRIVKAQSEQIMRERILSEDFSTAQKALEEYGQLKDVQAVCLSLEHRSLPIKRRAAEVLHLLKDGGAVKCLVKALEKNKVELFGGSEVQGAQVRLNASLISALNAITGLSLPYRPKFSAAEVRAIKARTDQWLSANKQGKRNS